LLFFISPTPRLHVNMLGLLARGIASGMLSEALDKGANDETLLQTLAGSADRQAPRNAGEPR
jgi:PTS system nitrogen regulatory IIA component